MAVAAPFGPASARRAANAGRARAPVAGVDVRWAYVAILVAVLPLFGQTFHYVKMLPPLWALSKAFPIVSLPLCLLLFAGPRPPGGRQMLLSILWLILVPSFISLFTFEQTFFVALTSQVKLLSLIYFFSFLALLRWPLVWTVLISIGLRWREERMALVKPAARPRRGFIASQKHKLNRWLTAATLSAVATLLVLGGLHWLKVWQTG